MWMTSVCGPEAANLLPGGTTGHMLQKMPEKRFAQILNCPKKGRKLYDELRAEMERRKLWWTSVWFLFGSSVCTLVRLVSVSLVSVSVWFLFLLDLFFPAILQSRCISPPFPVFPNSSRTPLNLLAEFFEKCQKADWSVSLFSVLIVIVLSIKCF